VPYGRIKRTRLIGVAEQVDASLVVRPADDIGLRTETQFVGDRETGVIKWYSSGKGLRVHHAWIGGRPVRPLHCIGHIGRDQRGSTRRIRHLGVRQGPYGTRRQTPL